MQTPDTSSYMILGYAFVDALYQTVMTLTTVGYGEVHEPTPALEAAQARPQAPPAPQAPGRPLLVAAAIMGALALVGAGLVWLLSG